MCGTEEKGKFIYDGIQFGDNLHIIAEMILFLRISSITNEDIWFGNHVVFYRYNDQVYNQITTEDLMDIT